MKSPKLSKSKPTTEKPSCVAPPTSSSQPVGGSKPETSKVKRSYPETKVCAYCNKTFAVKEYTDARYKIFCGRSCAQKDSWVGRERPKKRTDTCAECGVEFIQTSHPKRFCTTSCSAKWRCREKPRTWSPEDREKISKRMTVFMNSNHPTALSMVERIRKLKPMQKEETRLKLSNTLKAMGHRPKVRGGNGTRTPVPQQYLFDQLTGSWQLEYAISTGPKTEGIPTHYKIDIANPVLKVAIEVDGGSHNSPVRRAMDKRKDTKLKQLGWKVLRFLNKDILNWRDTGMPTGHSISTTLRSNGIRLIR